MRKALFVMVALFFAIPAHAQVGSGTPATITPSSSPGAACGWPDAPTYACARMDFTFTPWGSSVPSFGGTTGAGNCAPEPLYNNVLLCRLTDIDSEGSSSVADQQQFNTCCGDWADLQMWNADNTMFLFQNAGSGVLLGHIDTSQITPSSTSIPVYIMNNGHSLQSGDILNAMWDYTNPYVFYAPNPTGSGIAICNGSTNVGITSYTVNPAGAATVPTCNGFVANLTTAANCVPSGISLYEFFPDAHDQNFYFAMGTQDTSYIAGVYNVTNGCRWINTETQIVSGNWGPTGQATAQDTGTIVSDSITSDVATITLSSSASAAPFSFETGGYATIINTTNCSGALNVVNSEVKSVSGDSITIDVTAADCSPASDSGSLLHSFTIHGLRGSLDGTVEMLGPAGDEPNRHFWVLNSLNLNVGSAETNGAISGANYYASANTGHFTVQNRHFAFNGQCTPAGCTGVNYCILSVTTTQFNNLGIQIGWTPSGAYCPSGTDTESTNHPSYENNVAFTDLVPVITSEDIYPPAAGLQYIGQDEIVGWSRVYLGRFWRFASGYTSATSSFFACQDNIGSVAPNGSMFAFTSDMNKTLGTDSDSRQRCDVFVAFIF